MFFRFDYMYIYLLMAHLKLGETYLVIFVISYIYRMCISLKFSNLYGNYNIVDIVDNIIYIQCIHRL